METLARLENSLKQMNQDLNEAQMQINSLAGSTRAILSAYQDDGVEQLFEAVAELPTYGWIIQHYPDAIKEVTHRVAKERDRLNSEQRKLDLVQVRADYAKLRDKFIKRAEPLTIADMDSIGSLAGWAEKSDELERLRIALDDHHRRRSVDVPYRQVAFKFAVDK